MKLGAGPFSQNFKFWIIEKFDLHLLLYAIISKVICKLIFISWSLQLFEWKKWMQVIQSFVITVTIHEWILALYPWFIKLSHNKDKRSAYTKPPRVHSKRLLLFILVCLLGRREALRRLPAVWPNVELKSRQFFYKSWPKIWPQQFCFKMPFFAKIQIVIQVFALLLLEDLRPWFFKIAQSGHTGR